MSKSPEEIAEEIVKAEQAKLHYDGVGNTYGLITSIRDGDGGRPGGSLIDAITAALAAERAEVERLRNELDCRRSFDDVDKVRAVMECHREELRRALAERDDARAEITRLTVERDEARRDLAEVREVCIDCVASLVASISLMNCAEENNRKPSRAAPSNTMFKMMVGDYERSVDRARALLSRLGAGEKTDG